MVKNTIRVVEFLVVQKNATKKQDPIPGKEIPISKYMGIKNSCFTLENVGNERWDIVERKGELYV